MTIQSTSEYWSIVEKSDLFDDSELAELKQRFEFVADAPLLARKFIDARLLTDWQARFLLTGRHHLKVGQYVLLERIPNRVVGDRFLGIHKGLDRQVEVNLFPGSVAKNKELFEKFLGQASRVVGMDHRNLVHLYDIDREGSRYYFVYEHDTGTPLDRLAPGRIDLRTVADITRQMLDGIGYAHRNHLVHGQLSASQVRIDEKNQIRISDFGLATMMDQLALTDSRNENEFGNRPHDDEDIAAAGRIGLSLLEQHVGNSIDDDYNELRSILRDLSLVVSNEKQADNQFIAGISAWIEQHDASQIANAPVEPLPEMLTPSPTRSAVERPANGSSSRPRPALPNKRISDPSGNRIKMIGPIAGGVVALLLGGFAIYSFFGSGNNGADLSQAKSLDEITHENKTDGSIVDASLKIPAGKSRTSRANGNGKSDRMSALDSVTNSSNSREQDTEDKETRDEQPTQSTDSATSEFSADKPDQPEPDLSVPGNHSEMENTASPQETPLASPQEPAVATTQETNTVTAPVVGSTWKGLPVIDWKKAAEFVDQEVAIPGKIVDVGKDRSGAIHFLNYDKSNRDSFTVIIREKSYGEFPGEIASIFKNREVVITGRIFLFQDRTPEIEVTSADQVSMVGPLASGTPMTSGSSGTTSTGTIGADTAPFANLPAALPIPEFSGESSSGPPMVLGEINTGDDLLGMELVVPMGLGKKGLVFAIDRDKSNNNRWEIQFAERVSDAPLAIAELTKVEKDLRFQWTAPAETVNTINYLHNCLLRIKSPNSSTICALRTPVEVDPIAFTSKKANYRENMPVDYLPEGEFIFGELQPFSEDDFPDQNSENGYEVSSQRPATEVYFHKDVMQRFLAIGFKLDVGSQIKIEAGLMHNSLSGFVPFRESTFKNLGASVFGAQLELQNKKVAADNYDPPYGQKTKHKNYVKELSKQLDLINVQVEGYNAAAERAPKILDRPVHFRVMFKSEDVEIELARTKGWELLGNASPLAENQ